MFIVILEPFRIILPSSANHAMYPDNLVGKFAIELPVTIQLDHGPEWEMALEEMFWPIRRYFINPEFCGCKSDGEKTVLVFVNIYYQNT